MFSGILRTMNNPVVGERHEPSRLPRKRICCGLRSIPRFIRLILGTGFLIVGFPLLVTPIPIGLLLMAPGVLLITSASATFQARVERLKRIAPGDLPHHQAVRGSL